jgi:hypothetical protein
MFHTVVLATQDRDRWDAVRSLVLTTDGPLIASQNRPPADVVPVAKWTKNISVLHHPSPASLTEAALTALQAPPGERPRFVIVDELRTDSVSLIAAFAKEMRRHPDLAGRWGCYLANGGRVSFRSWRPAIDELLRADARLVVEMYPSYGEYIASGASSAERDGWLRDFFMGGGAFPAGRFGWLMTHSKGSASGVSVMFGVTDKGRKPGRLTYMRGPRPAQFLDRLFYVWMTRTGHPEVISAARGGAGS